MPIPLFPLIGPCLRTLRQCRGAREKGCEVLIVCRKDCPQAGTPDERKGLCETLLEGIQVLSILPSPRSIFLREIIHLIYSWRIILREVRNARPDIVHAHNYPVTIAFVTSIVCSLKKIPLVYDIHDGWYESISSMDMNPIMKKIYLAVGLFFEYASLRLCTGIVTVSSTLRESIMKRAGTITRSKPFVVMKNVPLPCTVDNNAPEAGEEDYLLYSGTLYASYIGLEDLIDILEDLQADTTIRLLIAGDGPYRKELQAYVSKKDASKHVTFLGHISRQELYSRISRAKLCVMPFRKNRHLDTAVPNKLFEYMECSKAFVYPDLPGFREVLGSENKGRYIPDSRDDLKRTILMLLSDDELRRHTGTNNRLILKGLTFEEEFSKLWELYGMVGKRREE